MIKFDLKSYCDLDMLSHCSLCLGVETQSQREILLPSGQWCECSPRFWHLPMVCHSVLSSWVRSVHTYLKTWKTREYENECAEKTTINLVKCSSVIRQHSRETAREPQILCVLPCSAISISRLPNSACLIFLTQKSLLPLELTCVLSRGEVSSSELSV